MKLSKSSHFLVFVCYYGKIGQIEASPEIWIIPSAKLAPFIYHAPGGRKVVQRSTLLKDARKFKDAWHLIARIRQSQDPRAGNPRAAGRSRG